MKDSRRIESILVTGAAGYTGSHVVRLLLNNSYKVIAVDNLAYGGEGLLNVWHHPNFQFIKGDIAVADEMAVIFKSYQIDAIVHLAAIVGDPACARAPELATKVNWEASVNLLDFSIKKQAKRFIFASSCSNYGKMADPSVYVDETSSLHPVSLYAELKVRFENVLLNELDRNDRFCPTVLRFATVYGISPRMRFDLLVNEFTKELALGRKLQVFGEQSWRPYCHVYDFARGVAQILNSEREKIAYEVFNVGDTSENYQKRMIIEEIKKIIPDAKIKYIHSDEDLRDYRVSFDKISHELGFTASKKLQEGIKEIKYLIDNNILLNPDDVKYRNS